ncbi:MAG: DUF456 domain-containing protein [Proteobacteria bacterium]|nr:DUF456 domain-containing protein [Pseudomonadota bacterium]
MIIFTILGLLISVAGLIGCFMQILPGPTFSYLAILVLSFAKSWEPFSTPFLIVTFLLTILVSVLDYIIPSIGAKKYGASKMGIGGSVIGMITGIFFFPPFGMLLFAFLGALIGEIITGKKASLALQAGWGIIVGNIASVALKLSFSGVLLILYVFNMF